jgi:hypothetical protein
MRNRQRNAFVGLRVAYHRFRVFPPPNTIEIVHEPFAQHEYPSIALAEMFLRSIGD